MSNTVLAAVAAYYVGTVVVIAGVVLGFEQLDPDRHLLYEDRDPIAAFAQHDGFWYTRIVNEGYSYDPDDTSSVAFFPLYPLLARAVVAITALRTEVALLIIAHVFHLACFVLLHRYVAVSRPDGAGTVAAHAIIAFTLWPTTFFFRMTYTEPLFLFLCLLALYGMHRRWPLWSIAVICGFATATRPVGIALVLPFAWHIWNDRLARKRSFGSLIRSAGLCAFACWGLLAYMLYQQVTFGDALAFAKTQQHWVMGDAPRSHKLVSLITLEPIWSVYVPSANAYWAKKVPTIEPLFNLQAANPIFFVVAIALVAYGAKRGWLNAKELLLAAGLIAIPYITRGYEMSMASQGRFVAVVFPMYIVLGQILARIPHPWSSLIIAPLALFLGVYAALFAAGFALI